MIASGHSYEQIVRTDPDLTYRDIFDAAAEAIAPVRGSGLSAETLAGIREEFPRAYTPWTTAEDDDKLEMHDGVE